MTNGAVPTGVRPEPDVCPCSPQVHERKPCNGPDDRDDGARGGAAAPGKPVLSPFGAGHGGGRMEAALEDTDSLHGRDRRFHNPSWVNRRPDPGNPVGNEKIG